MLVSIFVGVFGLWGLLPVLVALGGFVASEYLSGNFTPELLVVVGFAGLLPMVASFIIWHHKSNQTDGSMSEGDKAYKNLASELSQVATESEVVINAIGDGVMAIDQQGVVKLINPAAQTILGWEKQDSLALNYKSILQLIDQKGAALTPDTNPIQQALNTNQEIRNNNLQVKTKSEKKLLLSLVASPIGQSGSGAIVVFRDVTKERAEGREQAEFISTASHEMRTPVASIEGYLGLALNPQTAQIDQKARDFIMKAHEAAQHLGHLFQDLLDVSKADDKRLANNPKVIDVVQFTKDVVQGLNQQAVDKKLKLTFKPIPDDNSKNLAPAYNVNLDNDHIREILDNLIENGIKYTLKGEVVVDVTGTDNQVVVSVKDSGIGIPPEDVPHLFQKFYRVNNEETNQIGGTGLGLYLCRKLAESMGGRVWAESIYKQGSTFYVSLPRISTQDAVQLARQQAINAKNAANQQALSAESTPVPVVQPNSNAAATIPATNVAQPVVNTPARPAATTVPRGESLSREQIAAQVEKLKTMAKQQETGSTPTTNNETKI